MPFRSTKQRRYLWAKKPKMARQWTKKHGSKVQKRQKMTTRKT